MLSQKIAYFFLVLLFAAPAFSQQEIIPLMPYNRASSYVFMEKIIENGDTLFVDQLPELFVYPPIVFKSKKQETFYWRTVRDVKKALPYARLASVEIDQLNRELLQLNTNNERKKHIGEFQKRIFRQHEKSLRNLTVNQGRMLIKLIDREHGINTYNIIKAYKGGFNAVFWNTIAKFFGSDLNSEYDGKDKDRIIERVITLVDAGQL